MVRTTLSAAAMAVAILGLAAPTAPAMACNSSQCPLTVSMEPTGPAPQPLAETAQPAAAASATSTRPVRLDRFRKTSTKKATRSARQESPRRARSAVAYRSNSKTRQARELAAAKAEPAEARQIAAGAKDAMPAATRTAAAGAGAFALQSHDRKAAADVKIVAADEVNALDLAAGPVPAETRTLAMVATPAPVAPAAETTGRAVSLDSLQRELSHETAAQAPAPSDESWMRKMLLVLGGAFAAAAAAARLLLAA
jgi:hypothetical protein